MIDDIPGLRKRWLEWAAQRRQRIAEIADKPKPHDFARVPRRMEHIKPAKDSQDDLMDRVLNANVAAVRANKKR